MIVVRDLRFSYDPHQRDVLRGLSFDVAPGEIFGFLGPSGAGKSTTQRILTGLLTRHRGAVHVFGAPPRAHGRAYYERIGVSFEVPNLHARLTGRENLEFFAALYRGQTTNPLALLEMVGLSEFADRRVRDYSKGMRMRLNFCRALLRNPVLLFLDEPTTGQDPANARLLKDIIRARRDVGCTIFLTTHDMSVASELCDRVAFIVAGEIVLVDAPGALMVSHGERRVRVEYTLDGEARNGTIERAEFPLDGLGENHEFLRLLRRTRIHTLHTLDATLEDVFLAVTGRPLT